MHTRVHGRGRRLRELRGGRRISCYKGCMGKEAETWAGAALLMPTSFPPATHFQVLSPRLSSARFPAAFLCTRAPCGSRRPFQSPAWWFATRLPSLLVATSGEPPPDGHRPHPRSTRPSPHPATHHPCLPAVPAGRSYPCPGRSRAGSLVHGSALGLVRTSDAW